MVAVDGKLLFLTLRSPAKIAFSSERQVALNICL
jgi:hypothetical protein